MGIQERLFRAEAAEENKQHEKTRLRTKDMSRIQGRKNLHFSNNCQGIVTVHVQHDCELLALHMQLWGAKNSGKLPGQASIGIKVHRCR